MDVTLLIESNDLMFRYVNNDLVKSISFRFLMLSRYMFACLCAHSIHFNPVVLETRTILSWTEVNFTSV